MRKLATSLLTVGLMIFASGLWAQQASTPQNPAHAESGDLKSGDPNPGGRQEQSEPAATLKVDVKLVNVFVTVTDEHGSPVGSLAKENFIIEEDGRAQKISVFDK